MRFSRHALVVLVGVALLAADKKDIDKKEAGKKVAGQDAQTQSDRELIRGKWQVVSSMENGRKQPGTRGLPVSITARTIEFKRKGQDGIRLEYKLDPSKKPKVFDTSHELDPGKPIVQRGIFSLDGDTLKLCIVAAGEPRPKGFDAKNGTHFVLQRVVVKEHINPPDLLPRDTVGYAELRKPGELAKELAALLKGSMLEGFPEALIKLRKRYPSLRPGMVSEVAAAGLITAPELIDEISRIEGAAVAVTGIDKEDRNMPEFVAFIRPGESNVPGFMFRMFVATFGYGYGYSDGKVRREVRSSVESIGEVEGVQLYRVIRRQTITQLRRDEESDEPTKSQTTVRPDGPAMARLPSGMILVGTPERLKDVIRRAKGKITGPSLARLPAFQEARQEIGDQAGVFSFANPAEALRLAEQVISPRERELLAMIRDLYNPKAIRGVANSVTLKDGTFRYRWLARLHATEKSPPLEILPTKPLKADLLHFAPRDALFVAAVSNADGAERWAKLLEYADEVTKTIVTKLLDIKVPPASRAIGAVEGMLGFKIGDDVLAKIEAVGLAVPPAKRIKELITDPSDSDIQPPLVLLVRAADDTAAKRFAEELIPEVVGTATLEFGLKPETKKHGKLTLYTLPLGKRAPTLVYGQHASTLVVGVHPDLVAECLTAGASQQGFLADAKAKAAVKRAGQSVGFIIAQPATMASLALSVAFVSSESVRVGPDGKVIERKRVGPKIIWSDESDPMLKRLTALLKSEEPLVIALRREPDQILLEATYPGLRKLVPKMTDFAVDMALRYWSEASRGHSRRASNRGDAARPPSDAASPKPAKENRK